MWIPIKQILIAAHGSSLWVLVKYREDIPEQQLVHLNIPRAVLLR